MAASASPPIPGGGGHAIHPHRVQPSAANRWGRAAGHKRVDQSLFANPYFAPGTRAETRVALYRIWIDRGDSERAIEARRNLRRLRGKILVCTCPPDQPCHADVLLELANA